MLASIKKPFHQTIRRIGAALRAGAFFLLAPLAVIAATSDLRAQDSAPEILWQDRYYNPDPMPDDLILPMPCQGAMVFRPILAGQERISLEDNEALLGTQGDLPFIDGLRRVGVEGPFSIGPDERPGYYLAKYELTEAQYAVLSGPCPEREPRARAFVPQTSVSLTELRAAAERYSLWLLQNARSTLPLRGEEPAFVRLPTEAEWEFAARGGTAVTPAEFRLPRFDMAMEGAAPEQYIAHGGNTSAAGRLQVVGKRLGNALGLHDMLGNAAEFVEGQFSFLRDGREHGLSGGWIKRGGDARTQLADISAARRDEVAPFDRRSADIMRDRYVGGRFALAAIALPQDRAWLEGIRESYADISAPDRELPSAQDTEATLEFLVERAREEEDVARRAEYERIHEVMLRSQSERNAQRDRAIRTILESGAERCYTIVVRLKSLPSAQNAQERLDALIPEIVEAGDEALLQRARERQGEALRVITSIEEENAKDLQSYLSLVSQLATDYSATLLEDQRQRVAQRFRHPRRLACLQALTDHLQGHRQQGVLPPDEILNQFLALTDI